MTAHVAVVGGRGKTGRAVMEAVRARGVSARPLGRAELRATVEALQGASAVYVIAPNMHPDEPAFVRDVLTAAHDAGVSRIVYHSVAAPYLPEMPHHLAKAESERLVRGSGADWTILQPCAYVQNFVPALSEAEPALVVPYDPDRTFGLVDLADVGEAAASALTGSGPDGGALVGSSIELGGPARVSVRDVARAAGSVLGRDVPVRRITSSEWAAGPGAGLEARERDWLVRMFDYYDDHGLVCGPLGSQAVLGRPPRSVTDALRRELA
ncbi:NmrA family NAD(P)-binding protein [Aeromicrobium sp.]|uniref:NmrA family NAD(P)-binding protein n=1 Tax=Aeromicrobium sp. TaxID=1871063 RepID=UPI0028A65E62|nr:NmrA family NAD(P)-binding protein [Aeromicrobium sp.]